MRIAFVTPEYVELGATSGGLANFVYRSAESAHQLGHDVTVFTVPKTAESSGNSDPENDIAPSVRRLKEFSDHTRLENAVYFGAHFVSWLDPGLAIHWRRTGRALAELIKAEHRRQPFDVIHTADYGSLGLELPRELHGRVAIRCSSISEQCRIIDKQDRGLSHRWFTSRERRAIRSARRAYAPSQLTADYYSKLLKIDVTVIRPPFFIEHQPAEFVDFAHPDRFLIHFGNISRVKGSDVLAKALQLAWKQEPELRMVWAGSDHGDVISRQFQPLWGDNADRVQWLGKVPKETIYYLVKHAVAMVAPSRIDNLPNTVLESLALQTPVIGTRGASIDEIVVDGRNGRLVASEGCEQLAKWLVAAWRGEDVFASSAIWHSSPIFEQMEPQLAISRMLDFVTP